MSEWKEYKLGDIGSFNNGVNKSKSSFGHGYPFVNLLDIFDKDRIDYIPHGLVDVNQDELNRYNLREGDILFVRSSVKLDGVGKVCSVTKDLENTIYSGFIIRFRQPNLILDKIFSSYYLNSPPIRTQVVSKGTLSANSNVNQESLKTIKIRIPPIAEQTRIAQILSTTDAVIEKTQAAIAKYKAIKQGMLQDLFTRGIDTTTGKLRPKYDEAPELYKESKLGFIPKEWEVDAVENVSIRIWIGLVTTMTTHYVEHGVPLIRNNNIRNNRIETDGMIRLDRTFSENNAQRYVHKGDIVTVHTGDIGTSAIIDNTLDPAHGFATINTRVDSKKISNDFLCYYFNSIEFKNRIEMYATGDGRSNLNLYDFLYILIPFPKNVNEQKLIAERLSSIDKNLHTEQTYLLKLQQLKAGLMGDLLSGRKRVGVGEEILNS